MPTVVCCGATTLDVIYRLERMPTGPGKVLPSAMIEVAHGMATGAAAVARLGGDARLITRIGDDPAGARFTAEIAAAGVDCRHVRRVTGARSPLCTVLVDAAGERLVVPFHDPALGRDAGWLPLGEIAAAAAVLVDVGWPEGAAAVLDAARAAGIPAVLDAGVCPPGTLLGLAARSSHAVFSEPQRSPPPAPTTFPRRSPRSAPGSPASSPSPPAPCRLLLARPCDGRDRHLAPPPVVAVDTLAAGDVFRGAFALALAEGASIPRAIALANAAAALKCQSFGGRLGAPIRSEVEAVLALV